MTFPTFGDKCHRRASERGLSFAWEMSFSSEDFDREWIVTARKGTLTASLTVFSATATPTTPDDVVVRIDGMLKA